MRCKMSRLKYYIQYEKAGEIRTETAIDSEHLTAMVAECKKLCYKIVKVYDADWEENEGGL